MRMWRALAVVAAFGVLVVGCRKEQEAEQAPVPAGSTASPPSAAAPPSPAAVELLDHLQACEVRHRGLLLDLGTPATRPLHDFSLVPDPTAEEIEQGGASYGRLRKRDLGLTFWLDAPIERDLVFGVRLRAGTARRLAVAIDGRRLGSLKLDPAQATVGTLTAESATLASGRHRLQLRFSGAAPKGREYFADIDWIRLGISDEAEATYAAPTLADIRRDFSLDGKPLRSLVLRAPGSVRCPVRPAADAVLRLSLGYWGEGSGTAEVRLVEDGAALTTLQQRHVLGGGGAQWVPLEVDLGAYAGRVVSVELRAMMTEDGGRLAFGEPRLVRREERGTSVPEAQNAIVIVASALDRRRTPPWGPMGSQSALGELVRTGVAYSDYRVPTTLPAGVMATLLTGLHPRSHTVEDPGARLPASVRTLGAALKMAGGRTAYFTGVPTSFAPFGFNTGWDRFVAHSPVHDVPATAPIEDATRWLEQRLQGGKTERRLVVVHARGAHPPWDLPREDVAQLPPEEYGGAIDARRGGIVLGNVRARRRVVNRRLTAEEWVRLRALEEAALVRQNEALQRMFEMLRREDAWDDTLIVYLGDVAVGDPPRVPYEPLPPLTEDHLLVPLLVKFPQGVAAGTRAGASATTVDVTCTLLRALRLEVPEQLEGVDLFALASGEEPVGGRALVATRATHYSTRVGSWLLAGRSGRVPSLCQLDVDPACTSDLFDTRSMVGQALWRWMFLAESAALRPDRRAAAREPASIDPELAAALTVWGDLQ